MFDYSGSVLEKYWGYKLNLKTPPDTTHEKYLSLYI